MASYSAGHVFFSNQSNQGPKPNTGQRSHIPGQQMSRLAHLTGRWRHSFGDQGCGGKRGDSLRAQKTQAFKGWIFLQLVNFLERRLGRHGGHPMEASCPREVG